MLEIAKEILDKLASKGIRGQIVGSVAVTGTSEHDLDLLVPIKSRFLYSKYVNAMRSLGFTRTAGVFDHMEHNLEEWQRDGIIVDVWMEE